MSDLRRVSENLRSILDRGHYSLHNFLLSCLELSAVLSTESLRKLPFLVLKQQIETGLV